MAKKTAPSTGRRRTTKSAAAAPVDVATVTATEPIGSADDRARAAHAGGPTHDEIAEAAYQRYLKRGTGHGSDFDDWIEAERQLRERR